MVFFMYTDTHGGTGLNENDDMCKDWAVVWLKATHRLYTL